MISYKYEINTSLRQLSHFEDQVLGLILPNIIGLLYKTYKLTIRTRKKPKLTNQRQQAYSKWNELKLKINCLQIYMRKVSYKPKGPLQIALKQREMILWIFVSNWVSLMLEYLSLFIIEALTINLIACALCHISIAFIPLNLRWKYLDNCFGITINSQVPLTCIFLKRDRLR